jgi:hypothetical protein
VNLEEARKLGEEQLEEAEEFRHRIRVGLASANSMLLEKIEELEASGRTILELADEVERLRKDVEFLKQDGIGAREE